MHLAQRPRVLKAWMGGKHRRISNESRNGAINSNFILPVSTGSIPNKALYPTALVMVFLTRIC